MLASPPNRALGCLLVSWARLMDLADDLWIFPPAERREPSITVTALASMWAEARGVGEIQIMDWREVGPPKMVNRAGWSLTDLERDTPTAGAGHYDVSDFVLK